MLVKQLLSSGVIQLVATGLNFVLGIILAAYFGTSPEMDAYLAASTFILSLNIIFLKAHTRSFIPHISHNSTDIKNNSSAIFSVNVLLFIVVSLLLFLFSYPISIVVAPGLTQEQHKIMSTVFKIFSFFTFFSNIFATGEGLLQYKLKFRQATLVTLIKNILIILGLIILYRSLGIYSIAVSTIVSMAICSLLYFYILRQDLFFNLRKKFLSKYKQSIIDYFNLLKPIILGALFIWLIKFSDSFIASFLDEGSISQLNYAYKIIQQPEVINGIICAFFFPLLSKTIQKKSKELYIHTFFTGYKTLLLSSSFITFFIFLKAEDLIAILFERGEFSKEDTMKIAGVLRSYILVLLCVPFGTFFNNAYYSNKMTGIATKYSVISSVVNIVLNIIFAYFWKVWGLALASSIAYLTGNILQAGNLYKVNKSLNPQRIIKQTALYLLPATISFITIFSISPLLTHNNPIVKLGISFTLYSLVFLLFSYKAARTLKKQIDSINSGENNEDC